MTAVFSLRRAAFVATTLAASIAHERVGMVEAVGPQLQANTRAERRGRDATGVDGVALRFWDEGASQTCYR